MIYKKINRWGVMLMFMVIAVIGIFQISHAETSSDKTSIGDVKKETKELLQSLKSYTADQRDEAIKKTKSALEKLDKRMNTLEARIDKNWDKMDKAAREKARHSLKTLRKQRAQVADWSRKFKSSSADAWDHLKKGFSDAYKDLSHAWEKSEKEFGADK